MCARKLPVEGRERLTDDLGLQEPAQAPTPAPTLSATPAQDLDLGDEVVIIEENEKWSSDARRTGTKGMHGVIVEVDTHSGQPYKIRLEPGKELWYKRQWIERASQEDQQSESQGMLEQSDAGVEKPKFQEDSIRETREEMEEERQDNKREVEEWSDADVQTERPVQQEIGCKSRRPCVGDRVRSTSSKTWISGTGWQQSAGEILTVVEVDVDGDFKLKNTNGKISNFLLASEYYFAEDKVEEHAADSAECMVQESKIATLRGFPGQSIQNVLTCRHRARA